MSKPSPPPSSTAHLRGPRTQTPGYYPTLIHPPLPKSEATCTLFAKTKPPPLVFGFLTQNPPPSCAALSQPPTCSTGHYPNPTNSPLPKSEAPRASFAKTEPPPLGFQFLAPNPLPLARRSIAWTHHLNPGLPHPN